MVIGSTRDLDKLRADLTVWLAERLPKGSHPEIVRLDSPPNTGMSSETLLFDVALDVEDERAVRHRVARLEPQAGDHPVFNDYDLELQYRCLRLVAEHTDVPVPRTEWYEPDPARLGSPFFVMDRVEGEAPSDNPPYVFGGWLFDAEAVDRRRLQDGLVSVLARLHALDLDSVDAGFVDRPQFGATPLDQHLNAQRDYYEWARTGRAFRVIDRAFAWLEANRPRQGPTVLNWGDARIGNVLWRDFEPVAVLDWEMAALGAPEADLAWSVHIHDFFDAVAEKMEMPPMAGFFDRDDVIATYEAESGRDVEDDVYDYYEVFAGIRYAIVSIRAGEASVRSGMRPAPDSDDDLIMNGELLDAMLDRLS
jgi:aminoglycoside phosphotransferase (APT) family kinase protein